MNLDDRMKRTGDTSRTISIIEVEPMSRAHITPEQKAEEWEQLQQARETKYGIFRGHKAKAYVKTVGDGGDVAKKIKTLTVKALHEHFVLMEDKLGLRYCYNYGDAQLMMMH